jgi:hypothetical protein
VNHAGNPSKSSRPFFGAVKHGIEQPGLFDPAVRFESLPFKGVAPKSPRENGILGNGDGLRNLTRGRARFHNRPDLPNPL